MLLPLRAPQIPVQDITAPTSSAAAVLNAPPGGIVQVRVSVAGNGSLLAVSLEHRSGYTLLDQAAFDTFRHAAPLPEVPNDRPMPVEL